MQDFTPSELSTICLFFGVAQDTPPGSSLPEHYLLEESSIHHPIGDTLEVHPHGIVVTVTTSHDPWYFSRDFYGLVMALEKLTERVA